MTLFFLGPGHTDNDVCVGVDDVVFCGDLVEEGADPNFEDAFPQRWVESLRALATLERYTAFVPGHGTPVTVNFVSQQADTMELALRRAREVQVTEEGPSTAAMYRLPYQAGVARVFLDRWALIESQNAADVPPATIPEQLRPQSPGTPPSA